MLALKVISKCLKRITKNSRHYCLNAAVVDADNSEISNGQDRNRIVWIDMEMTGLNINKDYILEVACLITDENLNIISDNFCKVLHQPDNVLENMNDWCKKTHSETGLIELSKNSTENEESVDKDLLNFLKEHVPKGKCPMAGNSVYMDRLFLQKYMSQSNDYMHYRIIDVSSISEVVKRWKATIYDTIPKKKRQHRALDDILESIHELDFYRKNVFNATLQK